MKKSSKTKGGILLLSIIISMIILWITSLLLFQLKSKLEFYRLKLKQNESKLKSNNLEEIVLFEMNKAIDNVNSGRAFDIFEYFEGKDRNWLEGMAVNENGYARRFISRNGEEFIGKVEIIENSIFRIELEKIVNIDDEKIKLISSIEYVFPFGENRIENYSSRKIIDIEVLYLNENT